MNVRNLKMKILLLTTVLLSLLVTGLVACASGPTFEIPPVSGQTLTPVKKTMEPFKSDQELAKYLRQIAERQSRRQRGLANATSEAQAPAAPAQASLAKEAAKDEESVTNVQHAGVDEGGIVKVHGDHLVVLRRGRLFTVAIGDGALKPISAVDAFGPDINPTGTWYDEMLVSQDTVVVIG